MPAGRNPPSGRASSAEFLNRLIGSRVVASPSRLRTQYERRGGNWGTHCRDDPDDPAALSGRTCVSHRQPSGHSRSLVQASESLRRDARITGFAPGHSQVADPFGHCMHIWCGSQSKSPAQTLPSQAEVTDETERAAARAAAAAIRVRYRKNGPSSAES